MMRNISSYKTIIDENLFEYLKQVEQTELKEYMEYSIRVGGKRVRPALMLATYESLVQNDDFTNVIPFAVAIEYIHTYSLIHDDLPAMDNDDFRRGKPTSHKVFGEANAILAGDALLNTAFEIMTKHCIKFFDKKNLIAMDLITRASGANGMIRGQVLDIKHENDKDVDINVLKQIHKNKTGDLIKASIICGVILAKKEELLGHFLKLSEYLGIAFQIQDDILDCTSTFDKLGKPINSDIKNEKTTYVSIYGLDGAISVYNGYKKEILVLVDKLNINGTSLENIILEILDRDN